MFSRLDKFDGPIFEGAYTRWRGGDLYTGTLLTGFYGRYLQTRAGDLANTGGFTQTLVHMMKQHFRTHFD